MKFFLVTDLLTDKVIHRGAPLLKTHMRDKHKTNWLQNKVIFIIRSPFLGHTPIPCIFPAE